MRVVIVLLSCCLWCLPWRFVAAAARTVNLNDRPSKRRLARMRPQVRASASVNVDTADVALRRQRQLKAAASAPLVQRHFDATTNSSVVMLDVLPRYMWGWQPGVSGYCGETSFQSHGIFYGNWISSDVVRSNADQSELLLGVNDADCANNLDFSYTKFDETTEPTPQYVPYATFVKSQIDAGNIVVTGVFEKMTVDNGDDQYDHIVPIIGYEVASAGATLPINGVFYHDLYLNATRYLALPLMAQTRDQCSLSSDPTVQPFDYCIPATKTYAIALTGNVDENSETMRMMLQMPDWTEPDYSKEDAIHQPTVEYVVSAVISGLTSGTAYTVLRFDQTATVPSSGFLQGPYTARFDFTATGPIQSLAQFDSVRSDASVYYRCVLAS